jgi:mannose-6-phosphate isomerase-like protein (cupin superfamily)
MSAIGRCGLAAGILVAVAVTVPASAQTTLRTVLAITALPSVVEVPLHFKLLRVSVPAGQATSYATSNGFVYQVSGMLRVSTDGNSAALRPGEATFVPVGKRATYTATGKEPGVFLQFLLVPAPEMGKAVAAEAASVSELYHTPAPIPELKPGPLRVHAHPSRHSGPDAVQPASLPVGRGAVLHRVGDRDENRGGQNGVVAARLECLRALWPRPPVGESR